MQTFTSELRPLMDKGLSATYMLDGMVSQKVTGAELESDVEYGGQDRRLAGAVNNKATNMPRDTSSELLQQATETRAAALSDAEELITENLTSQPSSLGIQGFELRLVLEFCDCGNLRQALDLVCMNMSIVASPFFFEDLLLLRCSPEL